MQLTTCFAHRPIHVHARKHSWIPMFQQVLAFVILSSFVWLLRVDEIVGATRRQLGLFSDGFLLTLAFPDNKVAKRRGMTEQVTVHDALVPCFWTSSRQTTKSWDSLTPRKSQKLPDHAACLGCFQRCSYRIAGGAEVWLGTSEKNKQLRRHAAVGTLGKQQNCKIVHRPSNGRKHRVGASSVGTQTVSGIQQVVRQVCCVLTTGCRKSQPKPADWAKSGWCMLLTTCSRLRLAGCWCVRF